MRWVSELLAILGESLQLSTMPIPPIQHSNFRRDPTATDRILSFRVHRYAHSTYRIRAVAHSVLLVIPPTNRPTEHKQRRGVSRHWTNASENARARCRPRRAKQIHNSQSRIIWRSISVRMSLTLRGLVHVSVCVCVCVLWMGGGWRLNHEPWSRCLHKGLGMAIGRDRDQ